jgi:hypothetical protein
MPSIERSEATAALCPDRVRALFFGDFLLGQQKKVTRPPGRNPGASLPPALSLQIAKPFSEVPSTP